MLAVMVVALPVLIEWNFPVISQSIIVSYKIDCVASNVCGFGNDKIASIVENKFQLLLLQCPDYDKFFVV